MGHDEQDQVLSTFYAKLIFGAMLPVPIDGDQDPAAGAAQERYIQRHD